MQSFTTSSQIRKNIFKMKKISVLLLFIAFAIISKAQNFEGIITYKVTVDIKDSATLAQTQGQIPTEMKQFVKGTKVKVEQITPAMSTSVISDIKTKESIIMMDMFGTKTAFKQTKEEFEKQQSQTSESEVEFTNETKEIAGYKCKKAIIKSEGQAIEVFYSDEVKMDEDVYFFNTFSKIKGLLFEYSIVSEQSSLKFEISEFKQTQVDDSVFVIPSEYKVMTMEELQKSFGF